MSVGHVDGYFDPRARSFVLQYVESIVLMREQSSMEPADVRSRHSAAWRAHFAELDKELTSELEVLGQEAREGKLPDRLRGRIVAVFRGLTWNDQATALELIHALLHTDGSFTPAELRLYEELMASFVAVSAGPAATVAKQTGPAPMIVRAPEWKGLVGVSHPLLDPLEQTYSPHPVERKAQVDWDYHLIQQAMMQWHNQRTVGANRLAGVQKIDQLPVGSRFLDGFVYAMRPSAPVELIVLGDLHGCYSCLKAALLQSNFIERAWAHQWHPERYPDVKLVFLGDYIDRGRFSYNGVLRAVMQLYLAAPEHVFPLRGNHEYYIEYRGRIYGGVKPAEAINTLAGHMPGEIFVEYMRMFEELPNMLFFDDLMFVHAGIPRDVDIKSKLVDLAALNDPELRFQMLWSDPSTADVIPDDLQAQNARFPFGKLQFESFMNRVGCSMMVRGHEKIDSGFRPMYGGASSLISLFSAGGADNNDLPEDSSYRSVTPMAATITLDGGTATVTPWPIDYQRFNDPRRNRFFASPPEIAHKAG